MRFFIAFILTISFSLPARSEGACEDLWLSRNIIYDAYGYCFGSDLGRAIFDNNGCDTVDPELPEDLQTRVDKIWDTSKQLSCSVDQSQTDIKVLNRAARMRILTQPIIADSDKVCLGAQIKDPILLRKDKADNATVLGAVTNGDSYGIFHVIEGEWAFVTILGKAGSGLVTSGWTKGIDQVSCDSTAGS